MAGVRKAGGRAGDPTDKHKKRMEQNRKTYAARQLALGKCPRKFLSDMERKEAARLRAVKCRERKNVESKREHLVALLVEEISIDNVELGEWARQESVDTDSTYAYMFEIERLQRGTSSSTALAFRLRRTRSGHSDLFQSGYIVGEILESRRVLIANIVVVHVDGHVRNLHLGVALYKAFEARCRELKVRDIRIVLKTCLRDASGFWEKQGFSDPMGSNACRTDTTFLLKELDYAS